MNHLAMRPAPGIEHYPPVYPEDVTPDMSNARMDGDRPASEQYTTTELVDEAFGCPRCGNRDMDSLTWEMDDVNQMEYVECGACGAWYDPLGF